MPFWEKQHVSNEHNSCLILDFFLPFWWSIAGLSNPNFAVTSTPSARMFWVDFFFFLLASVSYLYVSWQSEKLTTALCRHCFNVSLYRFLLWSKRLFWKHSWVLGKIFWYFNRGGDLSNLSNLLQTLELFFQLQIKQKSQNSLIKILCILIPFVESIYSL